MHQSCLATWIRVSKRLSCEVCKGGYDIPDLVLEPIHQPHPLVLRLATYPYFVFSECLLMEIAYVVSHSRSHSSVAIYNTILQSFPYILLVVIAAQAVVMWPAIAKLQDKGRYLRYMFAYHKNTLIRFPTIYYYVLTATWFILSWFFPVTSSVFFLFIISKFYELHCSLVKHINSNALHQFLTVSLNRSQE